jgi:hypothetical protein
MPNGMLAPFLPTRLDLTRSDFIADEVAKGATQDEASTSWVGLSACDFYENDTYRVRIDKRTPHNFTGCLIHALVISKLNGEPNEDWRDLQEIKNIFAGREVEAVELYPASHRCVNRNETILYCFITPVNEPTYLLPFGMTRRVVSNVPALPLHSQRQLPTDSQEGLVYEPS